jgi:outer membrane protein assembly factor BamB
MKRYVCLCLVVVLFSPLSGWAADQPQWGQKHSRNMVSDETGLPDTFDPVTGENVKWSASLGNKSYGSPVISGGRVLIGANNMEPRDPRHQGDRGVLLCLDETDGSLVWQLVVPRISDDKYKDWPMISMCSPPTVEGDRVYTVTNRFEVVCLDLDGQADGNDGPYKDEGTHMVPAGEAAMDVTEIDADIVWLFDMPKDVGMWPHDSAHCSVLVDDKYLYINSGNGVDNTHAVIRKPDAPTLIVVDKMTGRVVAKDSEHIGPHIVHATWSSPALGEVNGKKQIIFGGPDGICYAFEPVKSDSGEVKTLKRIWRFDCDPAAPKENIRDYMKNREESPSNILGLPVFYKDRVYVAAGGDIWWGKEKAWLKCIDATQTGDVTDSAELWSYEFDNHSVATPSISNGLVFMTGSDGKVHCIDAETGTPYWTHELERDIWGSTLVADGKVYVGSRGKDFCTLAADKEKRVISAVKLDAPISTTPVAANGVLYIATMNRLYAIKGN